MRMQKKRDAETEPLEAALLTPGVTISSANLSFSAPPQSIDFDKLYVTYPDFSNDIWWLRGVIVYQSLAFVKSYLYHLPSFA